MKNWYIPKPDAELQDRLKKGLNISSVVAQLLINRRIQNVREAKFFLNSNLEDLHSPFLLKDMDKAVKRIKDAIGSNEKIMVWGDYDVDGISAVAILILGLRQLGAKAEHYLPNRINEGYGLNRKGSKEAKRNKIKLLITVDCGITAIGEVEYLNKSGIDVIVVDHHHPRDILPSAFAIINPLQKDCSYPYKYLAAVALAFKLIEAVNISKNNSTKTVYDFLDLVTLGTICDVAPVTGENRTLIKYGLKKLSPPKREGVIALIKAAGLKSKEMNPMHVGYILGPRMNASGRLGSPLDSLKLLLTSSADEAAALSRILNENNRKRQKLEADALNEAMEKIDKEVNFKHHKVVVLASKRWHPGIVGIVASRIADKFYRPTIIVSVDKNLAKGSGRSIRNFHLFNALSQCEGYLKEYGGHAFACGVTLEEKDIPEFKDALNEVAGSMLRPEDLVPTIEMDAELPLDCLDEPLISEIEKLSPYGSANPRPLFCSRNLTLKSEPEVFGRNHLKMWVSDGGINCEAIGFRKAELYSLVSHAKSFDLAYFPSVNNWQGMNSIQLEIEDLRINPGVTPG